MKIAIVRRFYGVDGGAQRAVERMLKAFSTDDIHVTLICENAPPIWRGSVEVIATNGNRTARLREFSAQAEKLIEGNQFDLVQAHEWIPGADVYRLGDGLHSEWLKAKHAAARGIRATRFARWLEHRNSFHRLVLDLERRCIEQQPPPFFICNSEMVVGQLRSSYPNTDPTRIKVVRNVSDRWASARDFSKVIGFAGSGWSRKGLEFVIRALPLLPDYRLVVAGKDKSRDHYRRVADRFGVLDRVVFLGVLSDMEPFYSKVSILVHPAVYDPFPNVTMEALARGIPCVVSPNTGTADFANRLSVSVVDREPRGIAEAVIEAEQDWSARSIDAVELAGQFDETYLSNTLHSIYQTITRAT